MKATEFYKFSGSGNDFIMIDNWGGLRRPPRNYIKKLCARGTGIGADGLILIERPLAKNDFKMVYYNSDGKEADMCGNGGRCAVLFYKFLKSRKTNVFTFESKKMVHRAEVKRNQNVKIELQPPHSLKKDIKARISTGFVNGSFINTGVPHFVVFTDDIEEIDVKGMGREIRNCKEFYPNGTNVNFVQFKNKKLFIRTYERGVEDETLACGTGSAASAIVFAMKTSSKSPVRVVSRSGEILKVHFDLKFNAVFLEGKVTPVYMAVSCI